MCWPDWAVTWRGCRAKVVVCVCCCWQRRENWRACVEFDVVALGRHVLSGRASKVGRAVNAHLLHAQGLHLEILGISDEASVFSLSISSISSPSPSVVLL